MAKQVKLTAQHRTHAGRIAVNKLKKQGIIPAVIYGAKNEPQNLQISARDINTLLSHASGENILVDLEIVKGEEKATRMALIQEVQHHPLGGQVLHVDFHAISMDEKIQADVPVDPVGEATGVKNYGGILEQNMRSLEIECLPRDLPEIISVDVSHLNIGDSIHVKDIKMPEGVTVTEDADLTVFRVSAPAVEEEPVAAAEAPTSPEVIKEKKVEAPAEESDKKEKKEK